MKLRLTPLNNKSQVIEQLEDLIFEDIGIEDIIIVRVEDTAKIINANKKLAELSIMSGKVFIPVPCNVKFFRLQTEGEYEKANKLAGE